MRKDGDSYNIFTKPECNELKDVQPGLYNYILNILCQKNFLTNSKCKVFCGEKNVNCDERVEKHCKEIGPAKAFEPGTSDLCGCFMGNQFYKTYFDTVQQKYKFPIVTPPSHVCYFDYCASSNIKPYNEKQTPTRCPDIMACFQNVDVRFDAKGNIEKGKVIVKQNAKCSSIQTRCATQSDCKDVKGSLCTDGVCAVSGTPSPPEPPTPTPPPSPPPTQASYNVTGILVVVLVIILVSVVVF